ncbi:MAG: sulfate ABC transporter substrate-binding protein [Verrucomicrobiales bacterium]|nr:sulfate ABC transporter substrate-binding protein [Verrucomicrobiales bacterium]
MKRNISKFMALLLGVGLQSANAAEVKILNVSYDVTREFYQDYNAAFVAHWKAQTGDGVTVNQSHGGSSKQARSVIDGLEADVVTMNNFLDLDVLHEKAKLIPTNWASRLPNRSTPCTSTILFIVRKGNPKGIKDWDDLVKSGVASIIPNPKTSGNGRYSYLAAYGYVLKKKGGDETRAREFVGRLFNSVPVLDTGGRGATTTFAQRGLGDVLLTFENEVQLTLKEFGADKFDVVVPSISILAENPVVWVDKVVNKRGTARVAQAYLEYLFSDAGQELAAKHHFRPQNQAILARYPDRFKPIQLFTVAELFGGWANAQKVHFSDGGQFDQIYQKGK